MSHRRKDKSSKEKKRKTIEQRPRVLSGDLRSGIYYKPLSEAGCTFTQRQQVSGSTNNRLLENLYTNLAPAMVEGKQTFGKVGSKAKVVP